MRFMKRDDLDKAIADFTTAIKLDPQNAHTYGNRAWAFERKRDFKQRARRLQRGDQARAQ